jgi:hypothetical protein
MEFMGTDPFCIPVRICIVYTHVESIKGGIQHERSEESRDNSTAADGTDIATAGRRPGLPEHLTIEKVEESRLLKAAKKKNEQRMEQYMPAVSYRNVAKGGDQNV